MDVMGTDGSEERYSPPTPTLHRSPFSEDERRWPRPLTHGYRAQPIHFFLDPEVIDLTLVPEYYYIWLSPDSDPDFVIDLTTSDTEELDASSTGYVEHSFPSPSPVHRPPPYNEPPPMSPLAPSPPQPFPSPDISECSCCSPVRPNSPSLPSPYSDWLDETGSDRMLSRRKRSRSPGTPPPPAEQTVRFRQESNRYGWIVSARSLNPTRRQDDSTRPIEEHAGNSSSKRSRSSDSPTPKRSRRTRSPM